MKGNMRSILMVLIAMAMMFIACKTNSENSTAAEGPEPTDLAAMRQESYLELLRNGVVQPFTDLLDNGSIDLEWHDEDGAGFLHHAVWNKQEEIAEALIHAGADVNMQRLDGYRPLHWAAYQGNDELCRLLLETGAEVDAIGSGTTALYWAVAHRQKEAVNLLLGWGADAAQADPGFPSALSWGAEELDSRLPSFSLWVHRPGGRPGRPKHL